MGHRLTSRLGLGLAGLTAMLALAIVTTPAWSEPGSAADAEDQKNKARAPELAVVSFYADWCGTCKVLDSKVDEVRERMQEDEQPVLFLTLDLTDEKTRQQAELLASLVGMDDAWDELHQRTGFALLVKPGSGEVAGRLTAGQEVDEIHASIAEHVSG